VIADSIKSELVFEVEPTPTGVSGHTEPQDAIAAPDFTGGALTGAQPV
jgi:hypothetical protein